jgi:DNA-binding GntR family transcriptional regulator
MQAIPNLTVAKTAAPLRTKVLKRLRQAIASGELAAGQRITEPALMEWTGVSRTVIREVLRQLESEGLVAIMPNVGAVVRELTVEEAQHLYCIRAMLDGLAARFLTENISNERLEALEATLSAIVDAYAAEDPDEVVRAKNAFYVLMYEGASSEILATMLTTLQARIEYWRAMALTHPDRRKSREKASVRNLQALVKAVRDRDPAEAETVSRTETEEAGREVLRLLAREV